MDFSFETEGEYFEPENQVVDEQTKMTLSSSEVSLKTNYAIAATFNSNLYFVLDINFLKRCTSLNSS